MHNNAEPQSSKNADIQYPHGKRPRNLKCEEQNKHLGIMGNCQQASKLSLNPIESDKRN